MKVWTVQNKDVINKVKSEGIYQPDFSKSNYLQLNPNLGGLYKMILESFNKINSMNLPGVIYAFMRSDDEQIYEIKDYEEFYSFVQNKRMVIDSLWQEFMKKDSLIMELNYEDNFNPIFVDINDFQFLMPPIIYLDPYREEDVERICVNICSGKITQSVFPSYVIQVHLPYIKTENILNTYSMFDFD